MKKIIGITLPLIVCAMLSGCASPGGAVIVGPTSYWNSTRIDKAKMTRSVAMSQRIAQADKPAVISAVNMAMSPGEIAVGYKVDVLALLSSEYSGGEILSQTLAATLDLAAEAAAGIALYNTMTKDSHDANATVQITNNGDGNISTINQGSGSMTSSGSNTAVDGGANGNLSVAP